LGRDIAIFSRFRATKSVKFPIVSKKVADSLDYFTKVLEDDIRAVIKVQYVDQIPKAVKGPKKEVGALIEERTQMDNMGEILDVLGTVNAVLNLCQ
jgi:translation initiation factor RLI1